MKTKNPAAGESALCQFYTPNCGKAMAGARFGNLQTGVDRFDATV
jgi:hypothetical protein